MKLQVEGSRFATLILEDNVINSNDNGMEVSNESKAKKVSINSIMNGDKGDGKVMHNAQHLYLVKVLGNIKA